MSYEFTIGVLLCLGVFWAGLGTGYWMHRSAHKDGVKLMDRVEHDHSPYEDYDEEKVQKTTGGSFESP